MEVEFLNIFPMQTLKTEPYALPLGEATLSCFMKCLTYSDSNASNAWNPRKLNIWKFLSNLSLHKPYVRVTLKDRGLTFLHIHHLIAGGCYGMSKHQSEKVF